MRVVVPMFMLVFMIRFGSISMLMLVNARHFNLKRLNCHAMLINHQAA
jgi:hypothetical protein